MCISTLGDPLQYHCIRHTWYILHQYTAIIRPEKSNITLHIWHVPPSQGTNFIRALPVQSPQKPCFHGGVLRRPGRPIGPREAQEIYIGSIESDEKRPKFFRRHSPSHGSRIRLNGRFVSSPLAVEGQAQHRVEDCSLHNR